jgi:hypothetical protein
MKIRRQLNNTTQPMGVTVLVMLLGAMCQANETSIHARVTYQTQEGVYVNAGSNQGLSRGLTGSLHLDSGPIVTFEVVDASGSTSILRLQGWDITGDNLKNQSVELFFYTAEAGEDEKSPPTQVNQNSTTTAPGNTDTFVPLLQPIQRTSAFPKSKNISHGRIGLYHSFQTSDEDRSEYSLTRVNTSGTIERIQGSAWGLEWSGNALWRAGDAYQNHADYQVLQPRFYTMALQRPREHEGFLRLGRFLPRELPGIGYLDGIQSEHHQGGAWRYGVLAGLKPDRINLETSGDEPTVAGYTTYAAGKRGQSYYSGTVGMLSSFYESKADRLAMLVDQHVDMGPHLNVYSTAELDFGIADTNTNSSVQLTRLDVVASSRINRAFTLRGGVDHWQRPDNQVQRDALMVVDDHLFDNGYWRYWIGGQHRLPGKLRLSEELSWIQSETAEDAMRWRIRLSRTGLWDWKSAGLTATLYNLEAQGADGYGSRFSAYLPLWQTRLVLRPAVGLRWLDTEAQSDELSLSYFSLNLDSTLSRAWAVFGGITVNSGDGANSTLINFGARYRW